MKKIFAGILLLLVFGICLLGLISCGSESKVETILADGAVAESANTEPETRIEYITQYVEVEKPVYIEKEVVVEKEVPVEVEKIVEVEKEIIKTEYVEVPVEVEKEVIVEKTNIIYQTVEQKYNITFATKNELLTENKHFDYLAIWNCSTDKSTTYSYVLPAGYEYDNDRKITWYGFQADWYINLSCFNKKTGEDLSQYIVDCTTREAPGRFKTNKSWKYTDTGLYILKNATIKYVHLSELCTYGSSGLYQTIIEYEDVFTPVELAMDTSNFIQFNKQENGWLRNWDWNTFEYNTKYYTNVEPQTLDTLRNNVGYHNDSKKIIIDESVKALSLNNKIFDVIEFYFEGYETYTRYVGVNNVKTTFTVPVWRVVGFYKTAYNYETHCLTNKVGG